MIFATRTPGADHELKGLPELNLSGLAHIHANALLSEVLPGPMDETVRENILAEADGNPLALLELHRALAPAQLAGGYGLAAAKPMATQSSRHTASGCANCRRRHARSYCSPRPSRRVSPHGCGQPPHNSKSVGKQVFRRSKAASSPSIPACAFGIRLFVQPSTATPPRLRGGRPTRHWQMSFRGPAQRNTAPGTVRRRRAHPMRKSLLNLCSRPSEPVDAAALPQPRRSSPTLSRCHRTRVVGPSAHSWPLRRNWTPPTPRRQPNCWSHYRSPKTNSSVHA